MKTTCENRPHIIIYSVADSGIIYVRCRICGSGEKLSANQKKNMIDTQCVGHLCPRWACEHIHLKARQHTTGKVPF